MSQWRSNGGKYRHAIWRDQISEPSSPGEVKWIIAGLLAGLIVVGVML